MSMASIHAKTTWNTNQQINAKRHNQSFSAWAAAHVAAVLNGGQQTEEASGSGDPLVKIVVWEVGTDTFTTEVKVWGTQQELDDAVNALTDAIADAGGTVISVT
jgi:hypothetical protein